MEGVTQVLVLCSKGRGVGVGVRGRWAMAARFPESPDKRLVTRQRRCWWCGTFETVSTRSPLRAGGREGKGGGGATWHIC